MTIPASDLVVLLAAVVVVLCAIGTAFSLILFARSISGAASAFVNLVQAAEFYRRTLLDGLETQARVKGAAEDDEPHESIVDEPTIYSDDDLLRAARASRPNKDDQVRTADENAGIEERDMQPVGGTTLFRAR